MERISDGSSIFAAVEARKNISLYTVRLRPVGPKPPFLVENHCADVSIRFAQVCRGLEAVWNMFAVG
jgi:hypothetical protein